MEITARTAPSDPPRRALTSIPEDDATQLARRIEWGDAAAESLLVELYSRGIGYLLRRLVSSPELAEDLHQETFRVVIEALRRGSVKDPAKLTSYVKGVAKNLARGEWRKRDRRGPHDDLEGIELRDRRSSQLETVLDHERDGIVHELLAELRSSRDRRILLGHYITECDRGQLCDELGIEPHQFHLVLFRARQRFRSLLEARPN